MTFLYSTQDIDPYKNIKFYTLENGLKVYLLEDEKSENVSIKIEVGLGSKIEDKKNAGIAHLVEHLVFRDKRVPHRDYYDYIIDEGATSVNGRTMEDITEYSATIDSKKSYWLVKTFNKMIFDKKVDDTDLDIEKNALQIEIGEVNFISHLTMSLKKIDDLFPKKYNFYEKDFNLKNEKDDIDRYYEQINNQIFTLDDVLKYYNNYYYPSNIILKIAGNFKLEKMKSTIANSFGKIKKEGSLTTKALQKEAKLNNKPFKTILVGGADKNYAYIGVKYIDKDYKKYVILDSYISFLEKQIQRVLRNTQGETYTVNNFYFSKKDAAIAGVSFDSLHKEFEKNILFVKDMFFKKTQNISTVQIEKALSDFELFFLNQEHDTKNLLGLINDIEYIHYFNKNFTQSPYKIFKSISIDDYKKTINSTFIDNNMYLYVYKDYYFFPYDRIIFDIIYTILFIIIYFKYAQFLKKSKGISYTPREIIFSRRISNRFISFIIFICCFFIAEIITQWLQYFLSVYILNNQNYFLSLEGIWVYLFDFVSFIIYLAIFLIVFSKLFRKFISKIEVLKDKINLLGSNFISIDKKDISEIKEIDLKLNSFFKAYGYPFLSFKKAVLIKTYKNENFYIRSANTQHLAEDLNAWYLKKDE